MQVPFYLLTYDGLNNKKKLFVYELHNQLTLPLFTNTHIATQFLETANNSLLLEPEVQTLQLQLCTDQQQAQAMFTTIIALCPDLLKVAINSTAGDDGQFIEIDTFMEAIYGLSKGNNTSSASKNSG